MPMRNHHNRGFYDDDRLIVIAIIAIFMAVVVPFYVHAYQHTHRHDLNPMSAKLHAIGFLVIVFVFIPLVLGVLIAGCMRRKRLSNERMSEFILWYVWYAFALMAGLFIVGGLCLMLWSLISAHIGRQG